MKPTAYNPKHPRLQWEQRKLAIYILRAAKAFYGPAVNLSTLGLLGTHGPVTSLALEEEALGAIYCLPVVFENQWSLIRGRKRLDSPLVPFIFLAVWTGAKGRISWCIYRILRVEQTNANLTFKANERKKRSLTLGTLKSTYFTVFFTWRRFHGI